MIIALLYALAALLAFYPFTRAYRHCRHEQRMSGPWFILSMLFGAAFLSVVVLIIEAFSMHPFFCSFIALAALAYRFCKQDSLT